MLLHLPLPWVLGPLSAVLAMKAKGVSRLYWPAKFRDVGLAVIGYTIGASFTLNTLHQIGRQIPTMLASTLLLLAATAFIAFLIARGTGISFRTTLIGCIPGGFTQMVTLSEELEDVDITSVTILQLIRLLSVIFIVPFLVSLDFFSGGQLDGGMTIPSEMLAETPVQNYIIYMAAVPISVWGALKLRLPTGVLLGPIISTAVLSVSGIQPPAIHPFLMGMFQLFVGAHIGLSMNIMSFKKLRKLAIFAVIAGVLTVAFSILFGAMLHWLFPMSFATAFLAAAPGGIAEMALTALHIGADLSIITGYQMFRVFFILLAVPALIKLFYKYLDKRKLNRSA